VSLLLGTPAHHRGDRDIVPGHGDGGGDLCQGRPTHEADEGETMTMPVRRWIPAAMLLLAACGGSQTPADEASTGSDTPTVATGAVDAPTQALTLGVTESTLAGAPNDDGFIVQQYTADLPAGATVRLMLRSGEFDTTIRVTGPDDLSLFNDDFGGSTNSAVQFQVPDEGDVTIAVSSYAPGVGGAYELEAVTFTDADRQPAVELGAGWSGRVRDGGAGPGATGIGGTVWFHAEGGERMTFRVTSSDFDTVAHLFGPTGQSWYNDDANDTGPDGTESNLDSTITAIAPSTGWYQLVVTPYGGGAPDLGFDVRTTVDPPVILRDGALVPDTGYAGPDGEGRVLGLFIGITEYASSPLYGCADDAKLLARAYRERGLLAPEDQILLTDKQATVAAVESALHELARRAGPEDMVVLFFSGHGGIVSTDDPIELDGTDETLVLFDGDITDTKFVDLVDDIQAGSTMLAIDACQSGGFERDFMTRPGRMFVASSDEDVLSSTAENVRAGGYLSWALREAVLGHGDWRPGDGLMTAGELTDYLVESFVDQHDAMNPSGSDSPLQRPIIARGSFNWYDTLWIYPRLESGEPIDITGVCLTSAAPDGSDDGMVCSAE